MYVPNATARGSGKDVPTPCLSASDLEQVSLARGAPRWSSGSGLLLSKCSGIVWWLPVASGLGWF